MKNNNVLIKDIDDQIITQSGIYLPVEKYNRKSIVIESGSNYVNPGDIIHKTIGNGTKFNIDGEDFEIIHENHILCIEDGTET